MYHFPSLKVQKRKRLEADLDPDPFTHHKRYKKYGICIYKGGIILNSRVGHMVYNVPVHNKSLLKILFCKFIGAAYFFTSLVLLHKFYI